MRFQVAIGRLLFFLGTVFLGSAFGQSDRGTITGTVTDPAGAVIAGAMIQASNTGTGVVYPTVTSSTGNYTIPQLPVGAYEVSVAVAGFKKYVRTGLQVQVAEALRVDITLEVGAATESVTVNETAPLLNTESGGLSHNVDVNRMDDLPILGIGGTLSGSAGIRNPYNMVLLIPGVNYVPNALMRINGTPANSQSFRVEGQDASNTGTPGVPQQTQPSVDAIQETAIQTSNFAAEYGQVGGGMFNVTMRSGTNTFHGSAYDYFVNEIFNAGNPFVTGSPQGNPRARARRNDYGFTAGGPVWIPKVYNGRDKTFFFFNFEQFREQTKVNNQFQTVPIAAYRLGDFSQAILPNARVIGTDPTGATMLEGMIYDPATTTTAQNGQVYRLQFPGNKIPMTRFDPVAAKIQSLFPGTSGPTPNGLTNNYLNVYNTSRITDIPSVKADQVIGSKGHLSFFWQRTKTSNPNGNTIFGRSDGLPDPLTGALGTFQNAPLYRLNFDYTLTPTILLHFGAGYRSNYFLVPSVTTTGQITNYNAQQQLGLNGGLEYKWFPTITGLLATSGAGGMVGIGSEAGTNSITQSPSFNTSATWVKGNHTYKFGGEFRAEGYPPVVDGNTLGVYNFAQAETGQPFQTTTVGGSNVGLGYASFLLGQVDNISISRPTRPRMGKTELGLFVQDSWKVSRKITFDYGLRYDYSTYLQEEHGRAPEFSPTTPNPSVGGILGAAIFDGNGIGGCNCHIAHNYPWAFAPRLGVAYQITSKTVFRAGFGIVYDNTESNNNAAGGLAASSAANTAPSFGVPVTTLAQGYPTSDYPPIWPNFNPGLYPTSAPNPGPFLGAFMDENAGRPPRQYQWSVGLQREIFRDLVVEAAYVGNRGVWWQAPGLLNLNAITPALLAAHGLSLNSPQTLQLLTSTLSSPLAKQLGFGAPYPGFPQGQLVAQALRPFPQFNGTIPVYWDPLGKSWYDSLQAKATKRFSHGLFFLGTFAWAKSLDLGSETGEPNPGTTGGALVNDVFNRNQNKYLSMYDRPLDFVLSLNYTTPRVGGHRALSWIARDWTYGAALEYASGTPIQVPFAQSNLNSYLFQGTSFANRVPGVPLYTVDLNCHCYDPNKTFVLNPAAWVDPAPGQWGASPAYYSDYRTQRRPRENMNLGRTWRIKERYSINFRMEFTNVFNRSFWGDPTSTNAKLQQVTLSNGNTSAGFGRVNTTAPSAFGSVFNLQPRQGVVVGRFSF
ncbi:MAG TPA: TonB-dependent receptor [Bryobacteraceae bacterium]